MQLGDFYGSPLRGSEPDSKHGIKFVTVGKITMTQKALIVSIVGFAVFAFLVSVGFGPKGLVSATLLLTLFLSSAYSVHCIEVGQCRVWSWVMVALIAFQAASIVGLHLAVVVDKKSPISGFKSLRDTRTIF